MNARTTALLLLAAWTLTACPVPKKVPRDVPRRMPPIAAAEPAAETQPASCVRFWTEARLRGYAYDHVVHLESGCHRTASCNVSTNVAPRVLVVAVEPSQTLEVVTLRGSENPDFVAIVRCASGTI
jgi:hypothetical protein